MPCFDELFNTQGQPIEYAGKSLMRIDKFPVSNGEELIVNIEEANDKPLRQGFLIDITGYCEIQGDILKNGKGVNVVLWANTMPNPTKIKIYTKKDCVWVKNIWESLGGINRDRPFVDSGHNGAAMIVEEIENGRRYRCNDGAPDDDFNDIIFTIQKVQ